MATLCLPQEFRVVSTRAAQKEAQEKKPDSSDNNVQDGWWRAGIIMQEGGDGRENLLPKCLREVQEYYVADRFAGYSESTSQSCMRIKNEKQNALDGSVP